MVDMSDGTDVHVGLVPLEFSTGSSDNENTLAASVGAAECEDGQKTLDTNLTVNELRACKECKSQDVLESTLRIELSTS